MHAAHPALVPPQSTPASSPFCTPSEQVYSQLEPWTPEGQLQVPAPVPLSMHVPVPQLGQAAQVPPDAV